MPTNTTLAAYDTLRQNIVAVLTDARERAQRIVERELAQAYVEVGRLLDEHLEQHGQRAEYGQEVFAQLAADLDIPLRRLYEMRQVYRALPIVRTSAQLGWSHYLALLKSPPAQRAHYAARAAQEGLSVRQLQEAINAGISQLSTENTARRQTPTLQPRRGILHAYRLVESRNAAGNVELALDLGFSLRRVVDLANIAQAAPGRVVASLRRGRGYALKTRRANEESALHLCCRSRQGRRWRHAVGRSRLRIFLSDTAAPAPARDRCAGAKDGRGTARPRLCQQRVGCGRFCGGKNIPPRQVRPLRGRCLFSAGRNRRATSRRRGHIPQRAAFKKGAGAGI